MDDPLRRLIAFVAGVAVEGHQAEGVFDFEVGSRFPVSGTLQGNDVDVKDETAGVTLSGRLPNLQTADGKPVSLNLAGDAFDGADEASGHAFAGEVSGRNVDFTDKKTGIDYTYCL
jgi:hypothetical protein